MTRIALASSLLISLGLLLFSACDRVDPSPEPEVTAPQVEISYDGPNQAAPVLLPGTYEAAVRFPQNLLQPYVGRPLEEVIFYIEELPVSATLLVYQGTDPGEPAQEVYSLGVTSQLRARSWHRIALPNPPVLVASQDVWVALRLEHSQQTASLGCDIGPAVANGDWLFDGGDRTWQTLRQRSGQEVDINWNLRGVLGAP